MPHLLVAPLSSLNETLATHAPSHLVSLLSPEHMIETPAGFPAGAHLKLGVNDIVDPAAGTAPPARPLIDQLLAFSRDWDGRQPLLIHCWAGISRSMASAYTVLCDRLGPGREIEIARAIRHADEALGRQGGMVLALNSMGPPLVVEEGVTTTFPLAGL